MRKADPDPTPGRDATIHISIDDNSWHGLQIDYHHHIHEIFEAVRNKLGLPESSASMEFSVLLTNDARLQSLNLGFREIDSPTNVLSFPYMDMEANHLHEMLDSMDEIYLGDIALSYETIAQEASEQGKPFKDHFTHMLLHGILHLLGYDHITEYDREDMESLEITILNDYFNIKNPYIIDEK